MHVLFKIVIQNTKNGSSENPTETKYVTRPEDEAPKKSREWDEFRKAAPVGEPCSPTAEGEAAAPTAHGG